MRGEAAMLLMHESQNTMVQPPAVGSLTAHAARVALVSTAPLERDGLKLVLAGAGFSVIAEAGSIAALVLALAADAMPELFLVDVPADSERDRWRAELGALRHRFPAAHIVVLAGQLTAEWCAVCWQMKLDGYLSKNNGALVFKRQLELVLAGERMFPFEQLHESAASPANRRGANAPPLLSPCDAQILGYLLAGHANRTIATRLHLMESTVKARMKSVFHKIHAANRTQAAVWALQNGIKPIDDDV